MMNGRAIWQQIDLTWARKRFSELRTLIDRSVPDCLISGHETLIQGLTLPDAKDRHVLAAAIVGRVNVIVTYNLKDFPADKLAPYGLMAEHPDTFISHLLDLGSGAVISQKRNHRASLKNPPKTVGDYLETLVTQGLVETVLSVREFEELL